MRPELDPQHPQSSWAGRYWSVIPQAVVEMIAQGTNWSARIKESVSLVRNYISQRPQLRTIKHYRDTVSYVRELKRNKAVKKDVRMEMKNVRRIKRCGEDGEM